MKDLKPNSNDIAVADPTDEVAFGGTDFEKVVISRVLGGDTESFELLVEKYKQRVFSVAGKFVRGDSVAEVAQSAFIKAFQSLASFRWEAPFEHWITTITVRSAYDFWNSKKNKHEVQLSDEQFEILDSSFSIQRFEEQAVQKETRELLDWSLAQLNVNDRMILVLFYLEGYSEKEIATMLGWSLATVKIRAYRARGKLKREIERTIDGRMV